MKNHSLEAYDGVVKVSYRFILAFSHIPSIFFTTVVLIIPDYDHLIG
jgi:hypothetical protein